MNYRHDLLHHRHCIRPLLVIGCLVLAWMFGQTVDALAVMHQRQFMIEFSFDTYAVPDKSLMGYRLYVDGVPACEKLQVDGQTITCTIDIEDGAYQFTLSALYSDNTESPRSPPFPFTIGEVPLPGDVNGDRTVDLTDATLGLQILVGRSPGSVTAGGDVDGDHKIGLPEILSSLRQKALR
jgi:hypothetical protein